jgi:hypothetical protein
VAVLEDRCVPSTLTDDIEWGYIDLGGNSPIIT